MQSYKFSLTMAVLATPLAAIALPASAQTQQASAPTASTTQNILRASENQAVYNSSGGNTLRWGNDRDHDRDGRDRDHDGRDGNDRDHRHDTYPDGGTTVIVNGGYYAPGAVYPGYAPYPSYVVPAYPYGYAAPVTGSSVTISTPGYSNGPFTMFPSTTTVTTFGNPVVPNYYGYRPYSNCAPYPNYPMYVPNVQGYRGAATPGYNFNGGSFPSGAFVTGSTSNYGSTFSAGISTGHGHHR
jgi:hypothetical protein